MSDPTADWAARLGIADPIGFQSRANSGFLTSQDINAIGQVSSVAPDIDSSGRVRNAISFWSDAVTRAQAGEHSGGVLSNVSDFFSNVGKIVLGTAGFGVGGVSGASAATGNGITKDTLALDAAGLAVGTGIAASGIADAGAAFVGDLPIDPAIGTDVSPLAQFANVPAIVQPEEFIPTAEGLGVTSTATTSEFVPTAEGLGVTTPEVGGASVGASQINTALDLAKKAVNVISGAKTALFNNAQNNVASNGQRSDVAPLSGTWLQPGAFRQQTLPSNSSSPTWIIATIIGGFILILFVALLRR